MSMSQKKLRSVLTCCAFTIRMALQRPVAGLDIAILLLRADRRRPRRHPEVLHQRDIVGIERSLAVLEARSLSVGDLVRGRGRVIGLVVTRHSPELEQRALHALA